MKIPFGKYRGQEATTLPLDYISWLLGNADHRWVSAHREDLQAIIDDSLTAALEAIPPYTLNDSQAAVVRTLSQWLLPPAPGCPVVPCAKLEGGAGYGKSFATMDIVKFAKSAGYTVAAAAPSFVAASVLLKQLAPFGVPAMTLAKTLKLTVEYDGPVQNYVMSEDSLPELYKLLGPGRLLILDEYSMIKDDLGQTILDTAMASEGKLLVVGDLKQLPPVKQNTPTVLASIPLTCTLTEPMRYTADSPLFALEQQARANPYDVDYRGLAGTEITVHGGIGELTAQYVNDYTDNPQDDCRMMFFKRSDAVDANAAIRSALHGEAEAEENPLLDGERLLVMSTQDVRPANPIENGGKPVRFYSSTTFQATRVGEVDGRYYGTVNGIEYKLVFMSSENKADPLKAGGKEFNAELKRLAEEKNWKGWFALKASAIPVGYAYAMTVHRCQGQTVDRAYFNPSTLLRGPMGKPLAYVAATRARKAVHVC